MFWIKTAYWKGVGVFLRVGNGKLQIACHLENKVHFCIFPPSFYRHDVAVVVQGVKILATVEEVLLGRYFDTLVASDAARHGGVTALCSYATP